MDLLGYPLYLAFIFLPGIGIGEALGLWKDNSSLAERLAYSFGLGLCVDTVVVLIRTSGLLTSLAGLDVWTLYATIIGGLALVVGSKIRRKKVKLLVRPQTVDVAIGIIILTLSAVLYFYLQKYPIFPAYPGRDIPIHVQIAQDLAEGSLTSVPSGVLSYGIHFQLASGLVLVGGMPLQTVRITMALLTALSPMLFYLIALRLTGSTTAGVLAAFVYALSGIIWFGAVFNSGLYANFFGILAALFLLVIVLDSSSELGSPRSLILLGLAITTAYFSHLSIITILPMILLLPILNYLSKGILSTRLSMAALIVLAPGAVGILVHPEFISTLLGAENSFGTIVGSTVLAQEFSAIPVLSYLALEITNDFVFVILCVLASVFVWRTLSRRRYAILSSLTIWFAAILMVSPLNGAAWRFSFEALVPFTLMASLGLYFFLPEQLPAKRDRELRFLEYAKIGLVLLIFLIPLVGGSWTVRMVQDGITDTTSTAQTQNLVNSSMNWIAKNTNSNARFLAVSDWRFTYSSLLVNRNTTYQYLSDPLSAEKYAEARGIQFVIVTNVVTESIANNSSLFPWNNFPSHSEANLSLIFSNIDVRIFRIGPPR